MKHNLILYFSIAFFTILSCKNNSSDPTNYKKPSPIQESISALKNTNLPDSLDYLAKQEDEQFQVSLSDSLLAEFRKEVGILFYRRSDFDAADAYFLKSEESFRKANLELQATQMLGNRAVINDLRGHYKEAIAIYLQVCDYFKEQQDSTSWASALGNIGAVYEEMELADKAIYYDKLSLKLNLAMHDTLRAAIKYNNIGVAFSELVNNSDSAVYYYTKAYHIYQEKKETLHTAQVGINLGMQYIMLHKFDLAKEYLEEAKLVFDSLGNQEGKANTLRYFGELYNARGDKKKAIAYFKNAMAIMKEMDSKKSLMETGTLLSTVLVESGNYSEAISMMQYANSLKDSLMHVENTRIIADMESKYQLKEKDKTIEILELKETLSKKQLKIQLVIIGLFIIVFILFILTYYFSIQKNKLKEKELRLELQNYILRIDELQTAAEKKDHELKSTEEKLKEFDLSDREAEVLNYIARGYKNSEIAEQLFLSQNTIKTHIKNIYHKLDVRNRVEALKRVKIS